MLDAIGGASETSAITYTWAPDRFLLRSPVRAGTIKTEKSPMGNRQFYRELGWGEKHW